MKIYNDIPEIKGLFTNPVITIGTFDGVHNGHRRILSTLLNTARQKSGDPVVITFSAHPRKVLTPETPPKILTTTREKIGSIAECGVENIILLNFTREMAGMSADEFFNAIILKKLGIIDIVIGYDHAFGKNREGNIDFLKDLSKERGFGITRVEPRNFYSRPVSSTWIRTELEDGNIIMATSLLGRPYSLSGDIVKGVGRGKTIGFPTANIIPDDGDKVVPKDGVYAISVIIDEDTRRGGMLNIGTNPTFSNLERTIEANIFDFSGDIYGSSIQVVFHERLRDEIKYSSPDNLVEQLKRDRIRAQEALNAIPK
jgi:riboflavin kinase/FMN adenylyltransferase